MVLKEGFIVCNNDVKNNLLRKKQNGFKNYIYISFEELIKKININIDPRAIIFIKEKYQVSYSLAKEYLDNLKWIEDKFYNNVKLDSLVSIYKSLNKQGFIKKDNLFINRLKQFPVTFIYPNKTKEYMRVKEFVEQYTNVYEIDIPKNDYLPVAYSFNTMTEECLFICNKIIELLEKGVSLNNIYIAGGDEYLYLFKRMAENYKISFEFPQVKNISSSDVCSKFILLSETIDNYQDILNSLNKNELYDKIIDLISRFGLKNEEPKRYIDFFKYQFKNLNYPMKKYDEAIKFIKNDFYCKEDDYIFYVGFNLGNTPFIREDKGYLRDNDLELLNLSTSTDINKLEKEKVIKLIKNKNVILTYKKVKGVDEVLPSNLIDELNIKVIQGAVNYGFSKVEDNLRLTNHYDNYVKFNDLHQELSEYGLQEIKYKSFNHKYKMINQEILDKKYQSRQLKLSYSSVKLYFECPFKFYADRILGLNEFKPQMAARLGTYSHAVLEDSYKKDFNFEESVKKNSLDIAINGKDRFFFKQMEIILSRVIAFNKEHESISQLNQIQREKNITVINDDYLFEGFIDKLMYKIVDNDVYAAIIDYKTGKDVVSLDNIEDGFNLQLPAYMYLLSKNHDFVGKNIHIIGIYLQKVNIVILNNNKPIDKQISSNFKLQGYTVSDPTEIEMFDPSFNDSTYIRSMSFKNGAFGYYSKVFSTSSQEDIVNLVGNLLDSANKGIKTGDFKISPKEINGENQSCKYCKYKDICFYDYGDIVKLSKKPFKEVK